MPQSYEIKVNKLSSVPMYKQIVEYITQDISQGKLEIGTKIPSIREVSNSCYLARDTVDKAYKQLKEKQLIKPVKGKGYYIAKQELASKVKVLLLLDKPSASNMLFYNSLVESLGNTGQVELLDYHCDSIQFTTAVEKKLHAFDFFISTLNFERKSTDYYALPEGIYEVIKKIPREKLILMKKPGPGALENSISLYENYQEELFMTLKKRFKKWKKYQKVILINPGTSFSSVPEAIFKDFSQVCLDNNINIEISNEVGIGLGTGANYAYVTFEDTELVNLLRLISKKGLVPGKEIGVISFNDAPWKALLNLTVINIDYKLMGEKAAHLILSKKKRTQKNPFRHINRNSA